MIEILLAALALGLSAGLSPGPLMALVISQSLQHGTREGCKVAIAPLISDAPIIVLATLLASRLPGFNVLLGILSLSGGAFVFYLAAGSFRSSKISDQPGQDSPKSWRKGVLTNYLSPSPWLFWFTVGTTTMAKALTVGWLAVAAFLAIFYILLCGSKVAMAMAAGKSGKFFSGKTYRIVQGVLGIALCLFAILLVRDGLVYLGVLAR
jgi:threonine/homoserine/homoserine lactone efflux protein